MEDQLELIYGFKIKNGLKERAKIILIEQVN
jgi:hypothetical protein